MDGSEPGRNGFPRDDATGGPSAAIPTARLALAPVQAALEAAGFYAYAAFDDQNRWTVSADDEAGHVDVRVGDDGFEVELWATSPGLYADEENEFRRRALERLVRMVLPNVVRGALAPHQSARWDEVEGGIEVRVRYELPFSRGRAIGGWVREHLPELEDLLTRVESQVTS